MKLIKHLKERGVNPRLYNMVLNYNTSRVTFYLYNFSGQVVGYQQYSPAIKEKKVNHPKKARYYTYLPRMVDGVFGLEQLDYSQAVCFVTEGFIEAANIHRLGFNAISPLGSSPKRMKTFFRILRRRFKLVALADGDPAGKKLVNLIGQGRQLDTDFDELSDEDKLKIIKCYLPE
jgi:DNA primase